ncbi:MAG: hypothetical protein IJ345_05410 [Clostridia bacterium]|nr:hypothetical protein [Clostridia bacterium]
MFFTKKRTDGERDACGYANLVDMHSHVLPAVDDGSESVERSLEMLRFSYSQGVRKIVATPHFYPHSMNPVNFLECRERAVKALAEAVAKKKALGEELPDVYLGAEVGYFDGISRSSAVSELCLVGTRILLIEMPFERWSESCVNELIALKAKGFCPVVAHYDRYWSYQERGILERLVDDGIGIQLNAEAFLKFGTKRKALGLVSAGLVDFLGSDCHNMTNRMPNLSDAVEIIEKSLGADCVERLMESVSAELKRADIIC